MSQRGPIQDVAGLAGLSFQQVINLFLSHSLYIVVVQRHCFGLLTWWIHSDTPFESRGKDKDEFYVPRDEVFEDIKRDTFRAGRFKALFHNLVPSIAAALSNLDIPFTCFSDIDRLYKSDIVLRHTEPKNKGLGGFIDGILNVGETLLRYDTPAVIKCNLFHSWISTIILEVGIYHEFLWFVCSGDRFAWLRDNEFGRQALAGVNPVNIELLKVCLIYHLFSTKWNYILGSNPRWKLRIYVDNVFSLNSFSSCQLAC